MFTDSNAHERANGSQATICVSFRDQYTHSMMDPGAKVQLSPWLLPTMGRERSFLCKAAQGSWVGLHCCRLGVAALGLEFGAAK